MRTLFARRPAIFVLIIAVVIALVVVLVLVLGKSSPTSPGGSAGGGGSTSNSSTLPTTTFTPPSTNTPGAASQVAKNEAVFVDERVGAEVTALNGSRPITQAVVDKAIAKTTGATGMTATVVNGVVTLKDSITIAGQTSYACATFSATTLSKGMKVIACP